GSFHTPRGLFSRGHEPAAVRLQLISTHYRANANFTEQGLKDSARQVERWRRFVEAGGGSAPADADALAAAPVALEFAAAMHDDLNIAGALGALNKWINATRAPTASDAATLCALDSVVGVLDLKRPRPVESTIGLFVGAARPSPEVIALLERRAAARKAGNFAESDAIRDQLHTMGYAIKDVAGGKVEVSPAAT
ncbi:MAG: hypothetical protein IH985_08945, partial [Planctomycetes bacterium]|nr:hypothetical protein [Planctomycetota bacterium]